MNTKREESLELLKGLTDIPRSGFVYEEPDDVDVFCEATDSFLSVDEEGQIQGGDALWFMFSEMRERHEDLIERERSQSGALSDAEFNEMRHLIAIFNFRPCQLTSDRITTGYITWKEAGKDALQSQEEK